MNDSLFLKNFLSEFEKEQKIHLSHRWRSFRSYLQRLWGDPVEYDRLLSHEAEYRRQMLDWIGARIAQKNQTADDVQNVLFELKIYREHLASRDNFLVVITLLLTACLAFYTILNGFLPAATFLSWLTATLVFFVAVERHHVIAYRGMIEEAANFLDFWTKSDGNFKCRE